MASVGLTRSIQPNSTCWFTRSGYRVYVPQVVFLNWNLIQNDMCGRLKFSNPRVFGATCQLLANRIAHDGCITKSITKNIFMSPWRTQKPPSSMFTQERNWKRPWRKDEFTRFTKHEKASTESWPRHGVGTHSCLQTENGCFRKLTFFNLLQRFAPVLFLDRKEFMTRTKNL